MPRIRQGTLEVRVNDPYALPDGAPFRIDVPYAGYLLNGHTPDAPWSHALRAGARAGTVEPPVVSAGSGRVTRRSPSGRIGFRNLSV